MGDKPVLRYEAVEAGHRLGPIRYRVDPELVRGQLQAVGQPVPVFLTDPATDTLLIEPSLYARNYIRLLRASFSVEGVIHARTELALKRPARAGQLLTVTGRVAEKYFRRGRPYVVVESATFDESGEEVSGERNTLLLSLSDGDGDR